MEPTRPPKLNAATHWMTSRQAIIPGESKEALKAHLDRWNALYPGVETDELLNDLVREAAFSSWLLIRSQRQYDSAIAILHKTPMDDWDPKHHHDFQLRERYLNSAQRSSNRHRSNILQYQAHLRSQARENRTVNNCAEADKDKTPTPTVHQPGAPQKNNDTVHQTVFVRQDDGRIETLFAPGNQHLLEHVSKFRYETSLVKRSLSFENRYVPPEYSAFAERVANFDPDREESIVLPITLQSLRIAVEREKEFGGHLQEWPDLHALDESTINLKREESWLPKE